MTIIYKTIIFSVLLASTSNIYAHSVEWSFGDIFYIYGIILLPIIIVFFLLIRSTIKAHNKSVDEINEAKSKKPNNTTESK